MGGLATWRCLFEDGPSGVAGRASVVPVGTIDGRLERCPSRFYEFIQKIEFGPLVCGDVERVMLHRYELSGPVGSLKNRTWTYRYLGCGYAVRDISCSAVGSKSTCSGKPQEIVFAP